MKHKTIANELITLKEADLALRTQLLKAGTLQDGYDSKMEALHIAHAKQLTTILDSIGYPIEAKVGKEASEAACLVIQHAISLPDFMRRCQTLLEKAVAKENASPILLVYLTDRIAVLEGKPQQYGTQFDWDKNGVLQANPFDDLDAVNKRRKSIGLNTLKEQLAVMRQRAKDENQLPPKDFLKKEKAFQEWRKRAGWIV